MKRARAGATGRRKLLVRGGLGFAALGLLLLTPGSARAEDAKPETGALIWYRSSSDCPEGADFLARIAGRNRYARLAEVGDRVDFVVTLRAGPSGSSGRLERQTSEGTVAIREVQGERCEEVADALALGLVLAIGRSSDAAPETAAPPASEAAPASKPEPEPVSAASGNAAVASPAQAPKPAPDAPDVGAPSSRPGRAVWFGAGGVGRAVAAPAGVWGAELHVEVGRPTMPRFRFALEALTGTRAAARAALQVSLFSGSAELCPLRIGGSRVEAFWCAGFDLGLTRVSTHGAGATRDLGLWAALSALERLRWHLSQWLALEANLGLDLPMTRYRIVAEHPTAVLHRIDPVGLAGGIGASVSVP